MRYQYVVILKKNSERATDLLSLFLCLFSSISFLFAAINSFYREASPGGYPYFMAAAGVGLLTGRAIHFVARRRGHRVRYRYLLIIAAIGWIGMTFLPWIGIF